MKELIRIRVTRMPLMKPTTAPMASTIRQASHHGTPCWVCSPIARICEMPITPATDRSNWLAVIGIITASAASA